MQAPVTYADLSDTLTRIGYREEISEFHGTLCGALCVNRPDQIDLMHLLEAGDVTTLDMGAKDLLTKLGDQSYAALQDSDMIFMPVLPEDDQDLATRIRALAGWCSGFLYGLATRKGLDLKQCTEDAREILRDFSQFTQASDASEESDLEESAYAELIEYIRVGAQLVFMELRHPPTPDPSQSKTLH